MIWVFWLAAAFPWSVVFLASWAKTSGRYRRILSFLKKSDEWTAYLFFWAVSPMLFFTFARNILWTYALPGLPAFSMLLVQGCFDESPPSAAKMGICRRPWMLKSITGLSTPILFSLLISLWAFAPIKNSQKDLLTRYHILRSGNQCKLIYLYDRPYSAEFYSGGSAIKATTLAQIDAISGDGVQNFFAVKEKHLLYFLKNYNQKLIRLGTYDDFILLGEPHITMISAETAHPFNFKAGRLFIYVRKLFNNLSDKWIESG